eukprot:CAMPEP_0197895750 /NCGR_PEP_ID=MMETSP1439-20131203/38078_1 /TAXON_ID=66791 /ORGANISM="Gonyaulax spinifera, Strain CCMP409" /LENGTH=46 /DNA_ID= /DNA_START= /DNA_END= /DNA_ORIENTATION=
MDGTTYAAQPPCSRAGAPSLLPDAVRPPGSQADARPLLLDEVLRNQ